MKIKEKLLERLKTVQSLSSSNKHKVGCIIVDDEFNVVSEGYNKSLLKDNNVCENDKNETFGYVVHAEENAIFDIRYYADWDSAKIIITDFPCAMCARLILQTGIKEIYVTGDYSKQHKEEFFSKNSYNVSMFEVLKSFDVKLYLQNSDTTDEFELIISEEQAKFKVFNFMIHSKDYNGMLSKYIAQYYSGLKFENVLVSSKNIRILELNKVRDFFEENKDSDIKCNLYLFGCTPDIEQIDTLLKDYQDILNVYVYDNYLECLDCLLSPNLHLFKDKQACKLLYDKYVEEKDDEYGILYLITERIAKYVDYNETTVFSSDDNEREMVLGFNLYLDSFVSNNYNYFESTITGMLAPCSTYNKVVWDESRALYNYKNKKVSELFIDDNLSLIDSSINDRRVDALVQGEDPSLYCLDILINLFGTSDIRCSGIKLNIFDESIMVKIRSITTGEYMKESNRAIFLAYRIQNEIKGSELIGGDSTYNNCTVRVPLKKLSELIQLYKNF